MANDSSAYIPSFPLFPQLPEHVPVADGATSRKTTYGSLLGNDFGAQSSELGDIHMDLLDGL